jgi:hypothetical protein
MHAQLVHIQSVSLPREGVSVPRLVLDGDVADQCLAALSNEGEAPVGVHELGVEARCIRHVMTGPKRRRLACRVNVLDVAIQVDERRDVPLRVGSSDDE